MSTDFDIVEIKFGPFAGWWVRDEAHRLGITEVANELGGECRCLDARACDRRRRRQAR